MVYSDMKGIFSDARVSRVRVDMDETDIINNKHFTAIHTAK